MPGKGSRRAERKEDVKDEKEIDIPVSSDTAEDQYREREKLTIFHSVNDYTGRMAYVAHWLTPDGDGAFVASAIGPEVDGAGLEAHPPKHPDQRFWKQKNLTKMPSESALIVTDCKLLPCDGDFTRCQYRVPALVAAKYGNGIPMAVFAHNEYRAGSTDTKWCYYTYSGASPSKVRQHIRATLATWEWE